MISVRDLHHHYGGERAALQRLDLEIPSGSIFALIGPNGAGKTTLLRVLATLLEPTYGAVTIAGVDALGDPAGVRRRLGFMADDFALYEDYKVRDYLEFFAACYGIPASEREARTDALLEKVRLGEKGAAKVKELSRGMRQRLCLAKTLVHDPAVLLLDEPASGLDPQARIEFRELLRSLGREGKTVVVSSHILSELSDFCDTMAILERGRCVVSGRIEDLLAHRGSERRCRLRVLGDPAPALALLAEKPGVKSPVRDPSGIRFGIEGGDEAASELLASLVAAGVRVVEFAFETRDLEAIFMKVSSHDVA